ncbi:glycogen debranching N-terminal domain-containing protein [Amorphoplanes digitatis]|uniref:Glycogen debranching enzyme n=1 Tax=Actinoplanes digitatis TaxID=1868 RepID=A0A7W7HTD5_9ACTN|nr:glycogen debranching N-terminal domain-containing protein [Actinoplanes digitatis]MBB4760440.1 glycogen debranching enzyme [Actinoplanes digitatis]GID95397.1 amylo-alpha-1,6-glucosidase [Actinoplanes digitatis]
MSSAQPPTFDLVVTLAAPTFALADTDGQIRAGGAQGVFHADARMLSEAVLRLDGGEAEPIGHDEGSGTARFDSLARPAVRVRRTREVSAGRVAETITLRSDAPDPVGVAVTLDLAVDLAPIEVVRSGGRGTPVPARRAADGTLLFRRDGITVTVTAERADTDDRGRLAWPVTLAPGTDTTLTFTVRVDDPTAAVHAPARTRDRPAAEVRCGDRRLDRLVARSIDDLHALRLADGDDAYLAAGAPWYLTLFGRDSIWAARMLLPLGTRLAAGTLRVLARRQGTRVDPVTGEAPGKIMHELRRPESALSGGGPRLPAAYYGTVDATPLWISLLHDAWRWGLPEREVGVLLPHLEAALGWLAGHADPDGDGFVEYLDAGGRGLANQGWKDSADAVRFHDGRLAEPPIALSEVQGYAYRAALDGAALLDAFGRPGARWREYAAALAERFRARFWVPAGHPALALDRDKRPVDSLTSNIGHLLGTGMLTAAEERAVAAALGGAAMSGGYGLRTMSALDGGFDPLSYHCGSVWAHDTAIVAAGLAGAGFPAEAARLIDGLLAAGEAFGHRLPELHAGNARSAGGRPEPYPTACRPQAWSAAAAVLMLRTAIGLEPDVPGGTVRLRPLAGLPFGPLRADGLEIAGRPVSVTVDVDGSETIEGLPADLTVS